MEIFGSQRKRVTKSVKPLLLPTSLQNMLFLQLTLTLAALLLDRMVIFGSQNTRGTK
jgi:hypothetical protein